MIAESVYLFFHRQYFKQFGDSVLPQTEYHLIYWHGKNGENQRDRSFHNASIVMNYEKKNNVFANLEFITSSLEEPKFLKECVSNKTGAALLMVSYNKASDIDFIVNDIINVTVQPSGDKIHWFVELSGTLDSGKNVRTNRSK